MSWNYRIIESRNSLGDKFFGIHEVFYSDEGQVEGGTEKSIVPVCDNVSDLKFELENRIISAFQKEVLENH